MLANAWIAYLIAFGLVALWFVGSGMRMGISPPTGRARVVLGLGVTLLIGKRFMVEDSVTQELAEAAGLALMIWGFVLRQPLNAKAKTGAT
jgi:hypothetical protein